MSLMHNAHLGFHKENILKKGKKNLCGCKLNVKMFTKRKLGCNSLILFICNVVCVMLLCYIDIKCKKLRPAITVCIN